MHRFLVIIYLIFFCSIVQARPERHFDGVKRVFVIPTTEIPHHFDKSTKYNIDYIMTETNIKKGLHPFFVIGYFSNNSFFQKNFTNEDIIQIIKKAISLRKTKFLHFYTPTYTDDFSRGNGVFVNYCFFSFFYDYKKADIKVHPSFFIGKLASRGCEVRVDEAKKLYDLYFEYVKDHPWRSEFIKGLNNTYIDVSFMKRPRIRREDLVRFTKYMGKRREYIYSFIELDTFLRNLLDNRLSILEKIKIVKFVKMHNCLRKQSNPGYRGSTPLNIPQLNKTDREAIEKELKNSVEGYLKCDKQKK